MRKLAILRLKPSARFALWLRSEVSLPLWHSPSPFCCLNAQCVCSCFSGETRSEALQAQLGFGGVPRHSQWHRAGHRGWLLLLLYHVDVRRWHVVRRVGNHSFPAREALCVELVSSAVPGRVDWRRDHLRVLFCGHCGVGSLPGIAQLRGVCHGTLCRVSHFRSPSPAFFLTFRHVSSLPVMIYCETCSR
jgi:hypothetical protein